MENQLITIGISILIAIPIAILWVRGIDNMKEKYPDYKGEDFLNWGENDNNKKKEDQDGWDDNKIHTEGNFG